MAGTAKRTGGFTIIELVIVMLVLSIFVIAILPRIISTSETAVIVSADMVASDIRMVQGAAMFEGNTKTITFDGDDTYTAEGLIPEDRRLPGGVAGGACSITFNSFGEPSPPPGGGDNTFNITNGEQMRTITVYSLTGKVIIN